jgi:valyl-tRNA synthetase
MEELARPALAALRERRVRYHPESQHRFAIDSLEHAPDWCISRQVWWGHQLPLWECPDGHVTCAEEEATACEQCSSTELTRSEDVLDTWFSSALWPFATLGWPDETEELRRHYPNDLLISGFDIIFFWDARMAMLGIHFLGDVPWRRLYLHGLVRDAQGQKMSKSKGNTVDPLGLIDKYGADALRFTLAAMESQGRDIKLDEKRVEGYRNFATKLWNAARFLQMNGVGASDSIAAPHAALPVNRWLIGEVVATLAKLNRAFDELRFDDMADAIYHFTWGTFCDWYVELVKGAFDEETKAVAAWAFDQILVMLHPLMPFITEELWNAMGERPYQLIVAKWPQPEAETHPEAKSELEWLIRLVSEIRSARTELNVPPGAKLHLFAAGASDDTAARLDRQHAKLSRLARLESIQLSAFEGSGAVQLMVDEATFALPLGGVIDLEAERSRLQKAIAASEKERDSLDVRLSNPNFTERAKTEAVEKARSDHAEKSAEAQRYRAALERLG